MTEQYELAPLTNFVWDGTRFELPRIGAIQRLDLPIHLEKFKKILSEVEIQRLSACPFWLVFRPSAESNLQPAAILFVFQFLLWLVVPTRTQIEFRFISTDGADPTLANRAFRILDQFHWLEKIVQERVSTGHLEEIRRYTDNLLWIVTSSERLLNSLQLTYSGITSLMWQARFICFSATMEGLLTYSSEPGIAKRLAGSFACLVDRDPERRLRLYHEFRRLYDIRSDIAHGRANHLKQPEKNIEELIAYENLVRLLWKSILAEPTTARELEKPDKHRRTFIHSLTEGFRPPES